MNTMNHIGSALRASRINRVLTLAAAVVLMTCGLQAADRIIGNLTDYLKISKYDIL